MKMQTTKVYVTGHSGFIGSAALGHFRDDHGKIEWDDQKPDGASRKLLDGSRIHAKGWRARTELRAGLNGTYPWYQHELKSAESLS